MMHASARLRALLAAGLLACAALSTSPLLAEPAATPEAKAGARAAAERGATAYKESRFADAVDLFQRAESLFHAPTHVLMIARSYVALGKLVLAREAYLSITREELGPKAPAAFKRAQADAEKELRELSPRIPSVEVRAEPATAKNLAVTIDDKPLPLALVGIPSPIDPGEHVFRATADGLAAPEKRVTIEDGDKATVLLTLAPVAAGAPAGPTGSAGEAKGGKSSAGRIAGIALMGLGAAGLGVGGVFGGLSLAKRGEADDAFAACGDGCYGPEADVVRALDEDANQKGTIGVVGLAAGGALVITGVVLFVMSKGSSGAAPAKASVTPWIGPSGGGMIVRF